MGVVHQLQLRAERCRTSRFGEPLVASVEEARQLVRQVAEQLAALSGREQLLCLASLDEVQSALAGRTARLEAEMERTRRELRVADAAASACRDYARAGRAGRKGR
jgi:hypothetical protein